MERTRSMAGGGPSDRSAGCKKLTLAAFWRASRPTRFRRMRQARSYVTRGSEDEPVCLSTRGTGKAVGSAEPGGSGYSAPVRAGGRSAGGLWALRAVGSDFCSKSGERSNNGANGRPGAWAGERWRDLPAAKPWTR